jgi:hypothetical protein
MRLTREFQTELVLALGLDPAHVSIESVGLSPWNSGDTSLVRLELVYIVNGTPEQIRAMLDVGQPLGVIDWG